jgi:hypothetical protein
MTEHDVSRLLRDHVAAEPPLRHTPGDAIRTARRQTWARGLAVGGAALGVAAATAIVALSSGGPSGVHDAPATGTDEGTSLVDVMESAAADSFTPYVADPGAAGWRITDVLGEPVASGDPAAQYYRLSYHPASGPTELHLSVGGVAPADIETFDFADTCRQDKQRGLAVSCTMSTLDDGSLLMTSVGLRTGLETGAPRMLTRQEAADAPPGTVSWVRGASLSTPDGMAVDAVEYVPADGDLAAPGWSVPLPVLRELVLDPALRSGEVAHEPFPTVTDE